MLLFRVPYDGKNVQPCISLEHKLIIYIGK